MDLEILIYIDNETKSSGTYYYRLKQIDFDGTFVYYNELTVDIRASDHFVLNHNYSNPFNPTTTISFE